MDREVALGRMIEAANSSRVVSGPRETTAGWRLNVSVTTCRSESV